MAAHGSSQAPSSKKIAVCIRTISKGPINEVYNVNEKVKAVVHEAVKKLGLDPHPTLPYEVFLEQDGRMGRKLQMDATFAGEGIKEGNCLIVNAPTSPDG